MKKKILTTLSVVLILGLAALGILAYLQDEDSDVNVMTLGNVQIEQIEQERDANGNLVDFTQAKPLYPYVGEVAWNDNKININGHDYNMFGEKLKNAVDKIITVKNTGKSDAYVRTIIAVEDPFTTSMLGINVGAVGYTQSDWMTVTIDGVQYSVTAFTYTEALKPGESSLPSLLQVYLKNIATNEDVALLGDTFDILAVSQAVQVEGFADAATALNTAFGEINQSNITNWFEGDEFESPNLFSSYNDYIDNANTGGNFVIADNFSSDGWLRFRPGTDTKFDLNGKTITAKNKDQALFWAEEGGTTHLTGEGTIIMGKGFRATGTNSEIIIDGGSYLFEDCSDKYHMHTQNSAKTIINGGKFITSDPDAAIAYCINGFIEINGGFFQNTANPDKALLDMGNNIKYIHNQKITLSGGTFVNWNPMESAFAKPWTNPDVPALIVLADGYQMTSETKANGDVWYTVVPK